LTLFNYKREKCTVEQGVPRDLVGVTNMETFTRTTLYERISSWQFRHPYCLPDRKRIYIFMGNLDIPIACLTEVGVEAPGVGEVVGMAVTQVPLAHQVGGVPRLLQVLPRPIYSFD
jgi:hypothetical protein